MPKRLSNLWARYHRVQPSRAFLNAGVDYAGPFMLKSGGVRSKTTTKAYIAIFICLATKAVHIEVVSDLTSDAFIAALRRFIGRKGRCHNLYSDNGTNFIGAHNKLNELYNFFNEAQLHNNLLDFAAAEEFHWHFMPPNAPHFGGLWEAGVKTHLVRVTGRVQFTFEELTTIMCQIESFMNSRAITPLSENPCEFSFLTPGHFLTGDHLMAIPDPDYATINRLPRWQHLQKIFQDLWRRWSADYLHTLQQRGKWCSQRQNIRPGMLVLIKEETPPLQWRTAIVEETHAGEDGLVRVVTVKTSSGLLKRPISKICPFPQ